MHDCTYITQTGRDVYISNGAVVTETGWSQDRWDVHNLLYGGHSSELQYIVIHSSELQYVIILITLFI